MRRHQFLASLFLTCWAIDVVHSQPQMVNGNVKFTYMNKSAVSVSLVGDFNGWSKDDALMKNDGGGLWAFEKKLKPGIYQYDFLVDGKKYENDPANAANVENYNNSGRNSVFVLTEENEILLTSKPPQLKPNVHDEYPARPGTKAVYLDIIWHQHQPLYVNPETDQLSGPWVRTHATKDYYDMAATLRGYPNIHCNINLTSSLLHQLLEYYVKRLKPFVDTKKNSVNTKGFWKKWKGKTDPWIDLALKPTKDFNQTDKSFLYRNQWNAFGISEVMIERFPEYLALKKRLELNERPGSDIFTEQQMREIKFWFFLAYFDPDFLKGPVRLPDGSVCDLSDYIESRSDGKFYLKKSITETDCNRIVAEASKVMANVVPIHKQLRFDAERRNGQIEVITTPYYHPILPLIYDSDLAKICQPDDQLPSRFSYPKDADAQVAKAVKMYREIFGANPSGMWPGEGSVAQPVLSVLSNHGIVWTASDVKALQHSKPGDRTNTSPFSFPAGDKHRMTLVFRNTELSDRIGFKYQTYRGEEAAEDFVRSLLSYAPKQNEDDVLITVILDGENAWEWYRQDIDGKDFLNALYRKLSKLYAAKQIITTTMSEYITGNSARSIQPHPTSSQPQMEWLWPGSWINGNYDTWIGEPEENRAWEYLLRTRQDLEKSGLKQPDANLAVPKQGTKAWNVYMAWEAMYAAEGSDWFWWFGNDQTAPAGDKPFDDAFRIHLNNVYKFATMAGSKISSPGFDAIINPAETGGQGAMAHSKSEMEPVVFVCDATKEKVVTAIFIVGNLKELGEWTPNWVQMYDDGTHGDVKVGDGLWSLAVNIPVGTQLQYKYTNSGKKGEWVPGEEFSQRNRSYLVAGSKNSSAEGHVTIKDTFGQ